MEPSEKKWIFRKWIKAAGIRALKTVAQTVASSSILAGILSILTSIAGLPEVPDHYDGPDYREG